MPRMRQFDKAFAMMDKYVALMPNDSNPQDSYAEILRLAGRFNQSIEHYRASLVINPEFYSSQFGIADTYSLMGDQVQARKEYEIGFKKFTLPELQQILWNTREATTYVREAITMARSMPSRRLRITRIPGTTVRPKPIPTVRWPCANKIRSRRSST